VICGDLRYSGRPADDIGTCHRHEQAEYVNMKIGKDVKITEFWKDNRLLFPKLFAVAKRVLCIPATSAASERLYSVAGRMLEMRRTSFAGGLVLAKIGRLERGDNILQKNDRSIFNHCDVIGQQGSCVFEPPLGERATYDINLGLIEKRVLQTDGQTDRRTDKHLSHR